MSETSSPTAAVSATQRVASWLTHMGVSTYAFDDTLGLASAQQAQGDAKAATRSLERLAAKYPSSSAAQIARQRLKK